MERRQRKPLGSRRKKVLRVSSGWQ
jgi:hypothetical protein